MPEQAPTAEELRARLRQLRDALPDAELDDDTLAALQALDDELHALLEKQQARGEDASHFPLLERVRAAEADFASRHPVAGRFVRDVIDALSRMGV